MLILKALAQTVALGACLSSAAAIPLLAGAALAQPSAVVECMEALLQRGVSEQNAAIACSNQANQRHQVDDDCLTRTMYKTFTAVSRFSNGYYDYGGDYDFLPQAYREGSGCQSRVCAIGPQLQVQIRSESEAAALCQGGIYQQYYLYPYPYPSRHSPYQQRYEYRLY